MTAYLTTKELAALLRIKERKVYDLAASGAVPCSKATGRLLFPRAEIEAWISSKRSDTASQPGVPLERPNIVLGSHDPLLEWALRESRSGLATYFDGSIDGLERFALGGGIAVGIHLFDAKTRDWNTPALIGTSADMPVVAIEWARRARGLVIAPGLSAKPQSISELDGLCFAARQPEAGAQILFESLCTDGRVTFSDMTTTVIARSEADAALAVAEGRADVCFGLEALARQYHLDFVPIIEERFDLVVDRRAWFEPSLQALASFIQSDAMRERAADSPGYDITNIGQVHFNGA
ncbi:MAG: helix-turn-helix transcriptional regulator [Pseudomonadota bacterium]